MLIEHRIYTTHTEFTKPFIALYRDEGLPIQRPVIDDFLGMFATEVGVQEQVVVMWRYASFEDRRARRSRLAEIPEWGEFLRKAAPMVLTHENRLLTPVEMP